MFEAPFPILYVAELERSLAFYTELLGFKLGYRWPLEGPIEYAYLKLGNGGMGLSPRAVAAALQGRPLPAGAPSCELCFTVPDLDAAVSQLRAAGVPELAPPVLRPWGERMAYFADPDGHALHLAGSA